MIKKANKNRNTEEVVAKCDQPEEVITNSCLGKRPIGPSGDNPQETTLSQYDIEKLIVTVRGVGAGMCAVTKMEVSPELILGLLK
jgi:hypothetical protein